MKHLLIAGLIASSFSAMSVANAAPQAPHMNHQPPGVEIVKSLRGLSLSDEQISQIKILVTEFKANNERPEPPERFDIESLLEASDSEILAQVKAQIDAHNSQRMAIAELRANVYALLTDEQKELLAQREATRNARHNEMIERMAMRDDAGPRPEHGAPRKGNRGPGLPFGGIELSDEQLASLKTINESFSDKKEQHKETMEAFKEAEKALIRSGDFSQSGWQALSLQYQDTMIEAGVDKITHLKTMFSVLTDEQRAELKQRRSEDEKLKQLFRPDH